MRLLSERSFSEGLADSGDFSTIAPELGTSGVIKVFANANFRCNGADRLMFLRVNGGTTGYKGFALFNGDASAAEWRDQGFYLGRNGWSQDASVSAEFTIMKSEGSNVISGFGMSSFMHADRRFLGFQNHGSYTADGVFSAQVMIDGASVTSGLVRFYSL
ncbi:hypothetical protein MAUB1S_05742 [Mycolicibacterium aubagnense]